MLAMHTPESKSVFSRPCHTASQVPLHSIWAGSTTLPYSPLPFPPPSPSSTPAMAWPPRTAHAQTREALLGVPASGAAPQRHPTREYRHQSTAVYQILTRPVGWV